MEALRSFAGKHSPKNLASHPGRPELYIPLYCSNHYGHFDQVFLVSLNKEIRNILYMPQLSCAFCYPSIQCKVPDWMPSIAIGLPAGQSTNRGFDSSSWKRPDRLCGPARLQSTGYHWLLSGTMRASSEAVAKLMRGHTYPLLHIYSWHCNESKQRNSFNFLVIYCPDPSL